MNFNTVTNVVDFSYEGGKPPSSSKNINVSFGSKIDSTETMHKAIVLDGTFSLKDRVKTLNESIQTLKENKLELEKASSVKERLKRAAITLLIVGFIVAAVAAMIFGGPTGLMAGAIGLGIFLLVTDMILATLVLGEPLKYNIFVPITMPILLTYYLSTYESKRAKNVEESKIITDNITSEIKYIARYLKIKKEEINSWLEARREETNKQIQQEKSKLHPDLSNDKLKIITDEVSRLELKNVEISNLIEKLEESYKTSLSFLD